MLKQARVDHIISLTDDLIMDSVVTTAANVQTGARSAKTNQKLFKHNHRELKDDECGLFLTINIWGMLFPEQLAQDIGVNNFARVARSCCRLGSTVTTCIDCSVPIFLQHPNL